ncbi:MAG: YbaK/EbsC family protein [Rhodobacteraceae bacterium]|nr:YbaK/EbsC family protein [Paracoccaceae bacterium]
MSESVARVVAALRGHGLAAQVVEYPEGTRTAAEAAAAVGCDVDQIVKSIAFRGEASGRCLLFLTAGGNRVDPQLAMGLAGEPLAKADADFVRVETGFAIGGVAPVGHARPIRAWGDPRLLDFPRVWAAAGTPRHVFPAEPRALLSAAGAEVAHFALR